MLKSELPTSSTSTSGPRAKPNGTIGLAALRSIVGRTKDTLCSELLVSLRVPTENVDCKNELKSDRSFLRTIVDTFKFNFSTAPVLYSFASITSFIQTAALPLTQSFASGWLVDVLMKSPERLLSVSAAGFGLALLGDCVGRISDMCWQRLGEINRIKCRERIAQTVQRWNYQQLEDGQLIQDYNRAQRSFYRFNHMIVQSVMGVSSLIGTVASVGFVSVSIDWRIGVCFGGFLALRMFRDKRLAHLNFVNEKKLDEAERRLDLALQLASHPDVVRHIRQFGASHSLVRQLNEIGKSVASVRSHHVRVTATSRGTYDLISSAIISTGVAVLGGAHINQPITPGTFITLWGALFSSLYSMRGISYNLGLMQEHHRFVADVLDFFKYGKTSTNSVEQKTVTDGEHEITLNAVKVIFGTTAVLDIEDFNVTPGSIVGVVGKEGAGKSTLIKVLLGRLIPSEGSVALRSADTSWVSTESLLGAREYIEKAFMQDFVPPQGKSIRELLDIARTNAPQGGLRDDEVYHLAGLSEFLKDSDKSLDTVIGASWPNGRTFSGGQMKQIALAMTLASNPRILVLDEPFANLSPSTADIILDRICEYARGRKQTVFVISHNYGSFSHADYVVSMVAGKITQYGPPEKVAHDPGAYIEGILDMVNPALRPLGQCIRYKVGVGLVLDEYR